MASDGADFRAAAQVLNELGDKDLRRDVYAGFKKVARPLGADVIKHGAANMPRRGGFAATVARAKMGQSNATTGRNLGVALSFRTSPSHDLKTVDGGSLAHPVFPRRGDMTRRWVRQSVPKHAFTIPFNAGQPKVAKELTRILEEAAHKVSRSVNLREQGARR